MSFVAMAMALLLAMACQGEKKNAAEVVEKDTSELATGASAKPEAPEQALQKQKRPLGWPGIKVNGVKIVGFVLGDDTKLLSITGLPPIGNWQTLIVRDVEGREFRSDQPSLLTGERTMKIVRSADQTYEFRVIQLEGESMVVQHRLSRVEVIEVHRRGYQPDAPPNKEGSLRLRLLGETMELDRQTLESMSQTPEPDAKKKRDTWRLMDLLDNASLQEGQSVILRSESGRELVLSPGEIADKGIQHLIKRNRRGHFHYRLWRLDETPIRAGGLRDLVEIELRKKPH